MLAAQPQLRGLRLVLLRADPPVCCFRGSEDAPGYFASSSALLSAPFSLGHPCTPSSPAPRRLLSGLPSLSFLRGLFGPQVVLLGNSSPGKRSGFLVIYPPNTPAAPAPRSRPRCSCRSFASGLPEGIVGRLEEVQGIFSFGVWE